ncbi:MAG: TIM barrel protein [Phycisphaerales bacterium]|nr:TIM barrel protein [Phycisphaerales bacterium]MCB9840844.1 TIM barrel protein [Phycisphaeraceae bacterium]
MPDPIDRRSFVGSVASAAAVVGGAGLGGVSVAAARDRGIVTPQPDTDAAARTTAFNLAYAPHFGMFRNLAGDDLLDQLRFMGDEGFTALEDNGMAGRPVEQQEAITREMVRLGMRMGVFVVNMGTAWSPTLATGRGDARDQFLAECRAAVEVAKRVGATWMTVVPGTLDARLELDYQNANVIDALRRGAEIFEPHGLVMVLEPLNHRRDHPGLFLTRTSQAHMLCRAVDSPACKILFDAYHQQISEGNLIPNIDLAWDEIAYIQVGDNPGRKEPGTGEINYRNVFAHLHARGYTGIIGMEHGNSRPGAEGERAVIDAYRTADAFDAR